jgi:hypothetical protein
MILRLVFNFNCFAGGQEIKMRKNVMFHFTSKFDGRVTESVLLGWVCVCLIYHEIIDLILRFNAIYMHTLLS